MKLKFMGDALDHWKGSLFHFLSEAQLLRDFAVDPMATDQEAWNEADFDLLARLLRVRSEQIIRHQVSSRERTKYFGEISHKGDLFLDPDTGVATGSAKEEHVSPSEIWQLLDDPADRLLVIYQSSCRRPIARRIDEVVKALEKVRGLSWCSYESGMVAMLFVARLSARTDAVAAHFRAFLERRDGRIQPAATNKPCA